MPTRMERLTARLTRLRAAEEQVTAQIRAAEARQRARQSKVERAADTRRRILLGAWLLQRMQQDQAARARIIAELDTWLTQPNDRALFGLEPRSHGREDTTTKEAQHG